jgi:hypothetical protein
MSGAIRLLLLSLYAFMAWTGKIIPLTLHVFGNKEKVNFLFTHEGMWGSEGISPFILNPGTKLSHGQMGNKFFCPPKSPLCVLDTPSLPVQRIPEALFAEVKRPASEADYTPPSTAI